MDKSVRIEDSVSSATLGVEKREQIFSAAESAEYQRNVPSRRTATKSWFFNFSRWWDRVDAMMPSSFWISPTTIPSGCAESRRRMIRRRGSAPSAPSMSAYRATSGPLILISVANETPANSDAGETRTSQMTSDAPLGLHGPAVALVPAGEGRWSDANPANLSAPDSLSSPGALETNQLPLRRNRPHLPHGALLAPSPATECFASQARCGEPV